MTILLQKHGMLKKTEIHDIVHETFDKLGLPDLACPIQYSNRMTKCMGYARWRGQLGNPSDWSITISNVLMPYASIEQQIDTCVHEACHVAGYHMGFRGHGREWKRLMIKCGYNNPQRCHPYEYGHIAKCKCSHYAVSPQAYSRNKYRRCIKCNTRVQYTGDFGVVDRSVL